MRLRHFVFAVIATLVALGCFRLSKWQLDRLAQRRERNAMLAARLGTPPAMLDEIPNDTAQGHYRRVSLAGVLDYAHELVLAIRSRDGAPGVYILTPLLLSDGRTVLVNRGWVYAPDGMTIDLAGWREPANFVGHGFIETFIAPRGPVTMAARPRTVRHLVRDSLVQRLETGTTLFPYVVVITTPPPTGAPAPVRVSPPTLSEGSHLSYAVQWAAFGTIAVVGMVLALRRGLSERRSTEGASSAAAV